MKDEIAPISNERNDVIFSHPYKERRTEITTPEVISKTVHPAVLAAALAIALTMEGSDETNAHTYLEYQPDLTIVVLNHPRKKIPRPLQTYDPAGSVFIEPK